ncbi:protein of unknown function [Tissierella praeacuta DSM 18095]|uniref:DUF5052 domain-containing protein n=1 Tax=Tissierella praeacuta DSM 18095 TaxID=1123404 RepID=A0A1M4ZUB9_9FIRM|nr:DUF5052 family protein [Tissierella praeacuta]TCU64530.1 uncharacterized protein DUF5052 [Tissierella praeacuta]SHF21633.1 protein of unknown function [Tissierella praeacuta DSM 18095]SUP01960.1 Uncharacterised protein [Tissierella praeacuta]
MKIKRKKFIILLVVLIPILSMLNGCALFSNEIGKMKENLRGRTATIQTYDEESNIIDSIKGNSISITSEDKFNSKDEEGNIINKSSVINLTIGGKSMVHVGSSLILYEEGLTDIFNEYSKKVDIENINRSTPFINRMVNDMTNLTSGKARVVLIRSQSGKPLATFVGNKVSYFATGIDKSTGILIDGKYLFIYRCDYTIYDMELLE